MTKEVKNMPELRFHGYDGEWEERKLEEISDKVTEKNKNNQFSETLTNSAEYGVISQRDFFDKDISNEKNLSGYYIVREDDFVYNPRISNFASVGPIKRNKLGRTGVMSPLYYVFRPRNIDVVFLEHYFETTGWHKFMKLNGDSGARADRFAIKDLIFKTMPIPYPIIEEQERIGNFFSKLDQQIELEEKKLAKLEEQKKGYMQKIFSQELRFKDGNGNNYSEWIKTNLKFLVSYKNGKGYEKEVVQNGKYNIINLNSISTKGMLKDSGKYSDFEDITLKKNDLIMILSDVAKGNLIGKAAIIDQDDKYLLNQRVASLRIKDESTSNVLFIYYFINYFRQYFINMSTGMSQLNINKSTVEDFLIYLPYIEEQDKIGNFFSNLDKSIIKQLDKIELLKERKKAFTEDVCVVLIMTYYVNKGMILNGGFIFENKDVIKVFKEVENYIIKDLNNNDDLENLKGNHSFLAIYDITHTFYLNYIDIYNCITISSARTLSRKLYELLLYMKYILESDKESGERAKRYFAHNEYEKVARAVSIAKDGGLSQQEIDHLNSEMTNLKPIFIDSFKNSKIKVNDINDITKWYMEKSKGSKKTGSIQQLSEYLKMNYHYEHIYRSLSKDVHSRGHDMKETLNILGKNAQIQNYNQISDEKGEALSDEIELSAFTNFIVSRYIEICCEFINKKEIWEYYKVPFSEYHNKKWEK